MAELLPQIRNAVRAVIIQDQKILMLRKLGGGKPERFALPGGGQDVGETLDQALQRECQEEIGTQVSINALIHIADFFKTKDTQPETIRQHVEFLFACSVPEDYLPVNGAHPDKHQVEVIWLALADIPNKNLYPQSLSEYLPAIIEQKHPVYIGILD